MGRHRSGPPAHRLGVALAPHQRGGHGGLLPAYGLLAQVAGANPSTSGGSGSCLADGICHETSTGGLAGWFSLVTADLAVLALTAAAVVNVALLRLVHRGRRA